MPDRPPIFHSAILKRKFFTHLLLGIFIITAGSVHAEQTRQIYETQAWLGGQDIWKIPLSRCAKLPEWKPLQGEPPLSLGKAIAIADKWVSSKGHGGDVESIEVYPVNRSNSGEFTSVFFYAIRFSVAPYGNYESCVVLMDGTVLEPELHPKNPATTK